MWKNILQASKITEATQFIVSYAKITEQIYFRLAVLYYSVIFSNIVFKKTGKKSQSYNIYQIFFISGSGCSKLTTSLVKVSLKFQTLISKIHPYFLLKK